MFDVFFGSRIFESKCTGNKILVSKKALDPCEIILVNRTIRSVMAVKIDNFP